VDSRTPPKHDAISSLDLTLESGVIDTLWITLVQLVTRARSTPRQKPENLQSGLATAAFTFCSQISQTNLSLCSTPVSHAVTCCEIKQLKQHFLPIKNAQFRDNSPLMGRGNAHVKSFGTGCPASQPQHGSVQHEAMGVACLRQQPSIMSKNMRLFATSKVRHVA